MIIIANIRFYKPDGRTAVYIGRQRPGREGSPLGNPYKISSEAHRPAALNSYRNWLRVQIQNQTPAAIELHRLAAIAEDQDLVLLCWCKERHRDVLCHGDVIKEAIEQINRARTSPYCDTDEKRIHCHECNGYLWSTSIYDPAPTLQGCPYQKDPSGNCTGEVKKSMKALSIRNPWAWAMFQPNPKDIENRDWSTKLRGRIAIHTSKFNKSVFEDELYWFKEMIGKINQAQKRDLKAPEQSDLSFGAIIGTVEIVDCVRQSDSLWFVGDYGFVLQNPITLPEPIVCTGARGFWDVPEEIEARLL
jgi:hypothetical protein